MPTKDLFDGEELSIWEDDDNFVFISFNSNGVTIAMPREIFNQLTAELEEFLCVGK